MLVLPPRIIPLLALMLPALAVLLPALLFRRESIPTPSLGLALLSFEILPATVEVEVGRRPPLTVPEPDLVLLPLDTVEELVPMFVRLPLVLLVALLVLDDEVLGTVTLLLEGQCVAPLLRVTLPLVLAALVVPAGRRPEAVPDPLLVELVVLLSLRLVVVVAVLLTLL